jgi:hypothetical protein
MVLSTPFKQSHDKRINKATPEFTRPITTKSKYLFFESKTNTETLSYHATYIARKKKTTLCSKYTYTYIYTRAECRTNGTRRVDRQVIVRCLSVLYLNGVKNQVGEHKVIPQIEKHKLAKTTHIYIHY